MSTSSRFVRAERVAPLLCGVLFALPVLIAAYPPMADLPLHEASVGLLRHWSDDRFAPKALYFLNFGQANQLFSLLVLLFSYVLPIAWASKIVVAALLAALPLAAARLADHLGAPRWTALLAAPVGLGWLFFWGLVQNIAGLVALLALLPSIDRFARRPTAKGAVAMCAAMLLLHFAHQAMQVVACAALVLFCLGAPKDPVRGRPLALRCVPVGFCIALVWAANVYSWHFAGPRLVGTDRFVFHSFAHKITSISGVLFGGFEPYVRNSMMVLAAAPVVLLAVERVRGRDRTRAGFFERVHAWRFEILSLLLLALYFAAPANIKSTTLVYHRFLPPAWAVGVLSVAARRTTPLRPLLPALCCAVPAASILIAWPTFVDSDQVYRDLAAIIDRVDPGSAVMTLNVGPSQHNRLWNPVVAMGHVVAVRGGRSLFDYTQSPVSPVAQRPGKEWGSTYDRVQENPYELRPDWDFTRFRYLLLTSERPGLAQAIAFALRDDANLIAQKGTWYLFESRFPVAAIDADEEPMPIPPPPTLRKKLRDTVRELEAAEREQEGKTSLVTEPPRSTPPP